MQWEGCCSFSNHHVVPLLNTRSPRGWMDVSGRTWVMESSKTGFRYPLHHHHFSFLKLQGQVRPPPRNLPHCPLLSLSTTQGSPHVVSCFDGVPSPLPADRPQEGWHTPLCAWHRAWHQGPLMSLQGSSSDHIPPAPLGQAKGPSQNRVREEEVVSPHGGLLPSSGGTKKTRGPIATRCCDVRSWSTPCQDKK